MCEEHCLTQGGQAVAQDFTDRRECTFGCRFSGVFGEAVASFPLNTSRFSRYTLF